MSTKKLYQYRVGAFRIKSDTQFTLLGDSSRSKQIPEIYFKLGTPGVLPSEICANKKEIGQIKNGAGHPSITVYSVDNKFLLDCHNTVRRVEFLISNSGRNIQCYPHNGARREDIEVWLFGLVLSFLLQNLGIYTLHAAAVNCNGRAIAFLGNNGDGKTTLAFYFLRKGHSLITDDMLALVKKKGGLAAVPGAPTMNLWPRTLKELASNGGVNEGYGGGKHRYPVDELGVQFCASEKSLSHIYLLWRSSVESAPVVEIRPVRQAAALVELLGYTRANSMISISQQESLLKAYTRLLSRVPVRRLIYPAGFEFLPEVYDKVLQDSAR